MDLHSFLGVIMPRMTEMFEAIRAGQPAKGLDMDGLDAELARLPDKPDENLR